MYWLDGAYRDTSTQICRERVPGQSIAYQGDLQIPLHFSTYRNDYFGQSILLHLGKYTFATHNHLKYKQKQYIAENKIMNELL